MTRYDTFSAVVSRMRKQAADDRDDNFFVFRYIIFDEYFSILRTNEKFFEIFTFRGGRPEERGDRRR